MEENREIVNQELFSEKNIQLMKDTICKGATNEEFELFLHACKRTGLDPFMRQIYAVKRWDANLQRQTMTMQTGIDGYRLIAERTKKYSPGKEPTYTYDEKGRLESATAYVKKMTPDGTWHDISASAYYSEYVQKKKDGSPATMWQNMPRNQLAKCAEALALRKCFPAELSGLYTKEEMAQSEVEVDVTPTKPNGIIVSTPKVEVPILEVTEVMETELKELLIKDAEFKSQVDEYMGKNSFTELSQLSYKDFIKILKRAKERAKGGNNDTTESKI